jgi:hypothetical protein
VQDKKISQRQSTLHQENSGFAAPTLGRHIFTFRGYRILFAIRNPYINRFTNHFSIHSYPSYPQKVVHGSSKKDSLNNLINKKNCWDVLIWVTGHCNRVAVSRNRCGVEKTVDTHNILIHAIKFYVCLQETMCEVFCVLNRSSNQDAHYSCPS